MPVTKSAEKSLKQDRRRARFNLVTQKKFKAALKLARTKPTSKSVSEAQSLIDRATKKGIIHKNKASRLKSALTKKIAVKTIKTKKTSAKKPKKGTKK